MTKRDFLTLSDLPQAEYTWLFQRSSTLKKMRRERRSASTLSGRTIVLLFEKASTRTRVSFESAMAELGGHPITLSTQDSQLSRGEPLSDTARVLGAYADALVMRTHADARLRELAENSPVPVINGLTDTGHPVQLLADLFTLIERFAELSGLSVCFIGDCTANTARSWVEASVLFGFLLTLCAPPEFVPARLPADVRHVLAPQEAAHGADVIVTDAWASMGQEGDAARRRQILSGYTVDDALLALAASRAVVLHCLPAHRGEEITESVLLGARSAVWDEAENRLHTQKALLELMLGAAGPQ